MTFFKALLIITPFIAAFNLALSPQFGISSETSLNIWYVFDALVVLIPIVYYFTQKVNNKVLTILGVPALVVLAQLFLFGGLEDVGIAIFIMDVYVLTIYPYIAGCLI